MFQMSKQGAVDVISGDDPLISEHLDEVAKLIDACQAQGQPRVVFDLKHVPLIDSAGLELLLDARDQCVQRGGLLQLAAPSQLCRDILSVTDADSQFMLFEDVISAVGSFAR